MAVLGEATTALKHRLTGVDVETRERVCDVYRVQVRRPKSRSHSVHVILSFGAQVCMALPTQLMDPKELWSSRE